MMIIGCDLHTRYQQIAMLDTDTGELVERRLEHENGEARAFYSALLGPVRVGIEATGYTHWFEDLLAELGHELWMGDAAKIRASVIRKQKTDARDAAHRRELPGCMHRWKTICCRKSQRGCPILRALCEGWVPRPSAQKLALHPFEFILPTLATNARMGHPRLFLLKRKERKGWATRQHQRQVVLSIPQNFLNFGPDDLIWFRYCIQFQPSPCASLAFRADPRE